MHICTIVAKNYVAHARVLTASFREHHPDGRVTVLVLDDYEGFLDPASEAFDVVTPFDIDLPEFLLMAGTYDVLELSTAVKPWLLRKLLAEGDHIVYLDPDIQVMAPLDEIADLAREHGMVLTPHNVAAMPRDGKKPSETDILIAGAYNLGFIGLGAGAPTDEFLGWWAERLLTDCIVDTHRGYFVDQRWVDLVPGMVPSVHFLRDPGFNVAYWNLPTRDIVLGEDGTHTVNGSPLRFFHFSGYDPAHPARLSKHQDRVELSERPELRTLCDAYGGALNASGYATTRVWPYTYTHTAGGIQLTRAVRRLYADGVRDGDLVEPLTTEAGDAALRAYAHAPVATDGVEADARITRFMAAVHASRDDLRGAFPSFTGSDAENLVRWFAEDGAAQAGSTRVLLGDVAEGPPPRVPAPPDGVNVVGYLNSELGVGEVARQAIRALDAVEIPALPLSIVAGASRQGHRYDAVQGLHNPLPVNLLCVNADQTPQFALEAGRGFFEEKYTIGWWWWEVSDFPAMWTAAFEHVDELWAGSRFVADTLAAVSPVPVLHVPMPVATPPAAPASRGALGLPDGFLFLFLFDFHSIFERKNPLGLVEAFRRAFPEPRLGVTLAIKSINHDAHLEHHAALKAAVSGRPDIVLLDRYLPAEQKDGLLATCDCYVSLHRSEGFGITLAEAMLLGKPVIATEYSGSADVVRGDTAFPVPHQLMAIGPGKDPYPAGGVWADPDLDVAAAHMRTVVDSPEVARQRADAGRRYVLEHHSPQAAGAVMRRRLEHLVSRRQIPLSADEVSAQTRSDTNDIIDRGPAKWPHGGRNPRKYLRALVLRAAKPVLAYQYEVARALAWSDTTTQRTATSLAARQTATSLAADRRLDAKISSVSHAATQLQRALQPQLGSVEQHIAGLQAFAEATEQELERLRRAQAVRTGPARGRTFRVDGRPGAGRALTLNGVVPSVADLVLGSPEQARGRLRPLLGLLQGPVADLTPVRGELLGLLEEQGVTAVGVDDDPIGFLEGASDVGTIVSIALAERLDDPGLRHLLLAAHAALRPGGRLVLAAENPRSPGADQRFWFDPQRVRPLPAEVLLALAAETGFADAYAFSPDGSGDWDRDVLVQETYVMVAER